MKWQPFSTFNIQRSLCLPAIIHINMKQLPLSCISQTLALFAVRPLHTHSLCLSLNFACSHSQSGTALHWSYTKYSLYSVFAANPSFQFFVNTTYDLSLCWTEPKWVSIENLSLRFSIVQVLLPGLPVGLAHLRQAVPSLTAAARFICMWLCGRTCLPTAPGYCHREYLQCSGNWLLPTLWWHSGIFTF